MKTKKTFRFFLLLLMSVFVNASDLPRSETSSGYEGDKNRIYVRAEAGEEGDRSSWQSAFKSIQQALDHAEEFTEIWVARGIYFPEKKIGGKSARNKSFQLKNQVVLLGGFRGDELQLEERDYQVNKTILSGDLKGDDKDGEYMKDNCFHVLTGNGTDSTAVVDGFIIRGGNADRKKWPDDGGGGMNNHNGSPTVRNCVFEKNRCFADGGGMRNWGDSKPRITQTIFRDNRSEQEGGGMMNGPDSETLVLNCIFTNNFSAEDGGAMYNNETKAHFIINCLFLHNSAALTGGAIYHVNNSQTRVVNCTLTKNKAGEAGGGVSNRDSNPELINCLLWENEAPEHSEINNLRSEPSVAYSNVPGGYTGTNNRDEDPLFAGKTYELSANSPCINKGNTQALPDHIKLDLNLNKRIKDGVVDLGAFEYQNK